MNVDPLHQLELLNIRSVVHLPAISTHGDPTLPLQSVENRCLILVITEANYSVGHRTMRRWLAVVLIALVVYIQHRIKPEHTLALVNHSVAPLQDIVDVLEALLDRIDVPEPKCKCAAICLELWVPK